MAASDLAFCAGRLQAQGQFAHRLCQLQHLWGISEGPGIEPSLHSRHLHSLYSALHSEEQFHPFQSQFTINSNPTPSQGKYLVDLNSDGMHDEVVFDSQLPSEDATMQPNPNPIPTQQPLVDRTTGKRTKRGATSDPSSATKQSISRFHWDTRSTSVLIEVKRAHELDTFYAGVGGRSKTLEEQWCEIVAVMAGRGVLVDWKAEYDKWKRLASIHKEISYWERKYTPSDKSSYWQMSARERKDEGKFSNLNFDRDVFDLMERYYGHDPVLNPPTSVIDSSNNMRTPRTPGAGDSDCVDETFERTPTNGGVPNRVQKRTHVYDVGLKESTKDIAQALETAEEAKNVRHKDIIDLERTKVEIGLRSAMGLEGLSNALNRIADKM